MKLSEMREKTVEELQSAIVDGKRFVQLQITTINTQIRKHSINF